MINKIRDTIKTVKIYLKSQRKPVEFTVDKKSQADELFDKIESTISVVRFGCFIFSMNDFLFAIYEEK